jgi:signal transduction histidine kinase
MTVWYTALLAAVLAAVGAFLVIRLRADLVASMDRTLRPAVAQIAGDYRTGGPRDISDSAQTVLGGERVAAQVLDGGRVVVAYGDPIAHAPMTRATSGIATVRLGRQDFRVAARRVVRDGRPQVVVAGESMAPVTRSVDSLLELLLLAGPAALAVTAVGGWWLARRSLRPIHRITTTAGEIGPERLGDRVAVPAAADEVGHLARTLNTMLDRLQRGVEEQHRLVADASHELRTPLAAMRSELDVSLRVDDLEPAARGILESVREEVVRLARTVDDLLTLAGADGGALVLDCEAVDLATLAAEVAPGVPVAGGPAIVTGDPERLRQAIRNLVDNAIAYGPPGGRVEILVSDTGVTVLDEGPGVPPELRERIFDRFVRADPSRTRATGGSGLGLAIVREIVAAHGGRAWVEPRPEGGSAFRIALPSTAARHSPDRTGAPPLRAPAS